MSENVFLSEFESIPTFFSGGDIEKNPPISIEKIKVVLNKISDKNVARNFGLVFPKEIKNSTIKICSDNIAEFVYGEHNTSYKIAYRTYRASKKKESPFFSISKNQIIKLKNKNVKYELLIFWEQQEARGVAPTYMYAFELDKIAQIWKQQGDTDRNPLYRISFQYRNKNNDKEYVFQRENSSSDKINITLVKCDTGTIMSQDTGKEDT